MVVLQIISVLLYLQHVGDKCYFVLFVGLKTASLDLGSFHGVSQQILMSSLLDVTICTDVIKLIKSTVY